MYTLEINGIHINLLADLQKSDYNTVTFKVINVPEYKGMAFDSAIIDALITIPVAVPVGIFTNWLYDKLKEYGIKKTMINQRPIDINKITVEELLSIIAEHQKIEADKHDAEK